MIVCFRSECHSPEPCAYSGMPGLAGGSKKNHLNVSTSMILLAEILQQVSTKRGK